MERAPIIFTVPGEAKAWARSGQSGKAHFTPKPQRNHGALVKIVAAQAMAGRPPLDETCEVRITIRRPVPVSASKPKRAAMLAGGIRPGGRPDWDNYAKQICDALNGICWRDDALVCRGVVDKIYAEIPGVEVAIFPRGEAWL